MATTVLSYNVVMEAVGDTPSHVTVTVRLARARSSQGYAMECNACGSELEHPASRPCVSFRMVIIRLRRINYYYY
jgi:hypothetical protein